MEGGGIIIYFFYKERLFLQKSRPGSVNQDIWVLFPVPDFAVSSWAA